MHKLEINDLANIYYNSKKSTYLVTDIYTELKDSDIEIPVSNNLLILTTCYGKDEQLVVIASQILGKNVEE